MLRHVWVWLLVGAVVALVGMTAAAVSQPEEQLTIAFDTSIAPTYLDPAETTGIAAPFVFLYALHDALLKPLPGNLLAPCLAESWTESADGLVYEFKLREGLTFHNGDPFTAEDVKFSFLRYKGTSAKLLHDKVKAVEVLDTHRLRFVLHTLWPDFLTFYATPATGAAWIVPKKYVEQVGDDGFKRHPIGLGPYRFLRADPGGGTRARGERGLLAQGPVDQTDSLQRGARAPHPPGDAQDGGGGPGHLHDWRRRDRGATRLEAAAGGDQRTCDLVDGVHGAVGPHLPLA